MGNENDLAVVLTNWDPRKVALVKSVLNGAGIWCLPEATGCRDGRLVSYQDQ